MKQLVNGFYEDVVGKTEDELIAEVCAFNNYTLITRSFKDVVVFKDSKGEMISISNVNLINHTNEYKENEILKKELERMEIQKEENRSFWSNLPNDHFKPLTDEQIQCLRSKFLVIDWSLIGMQPHVPLYGLFDKGEKEIIKLDEDEAGYYNEMGHYIDFAVENEDDEE